MEKLRFLQIHAWRVLGVFRPDKACLWIEKDLWSTSVHIKSFIYWDSARLEVFKYVLRKSTDSLMIAKQRLVFS